MANGMLRYKLFWQGCKDSNAGVGFLVSRRWLDSVVDVKRVNERVMPLKVSVGEWLVTCICAYVPVMGRNADCFLNQMLSVTGSIVV